MTVVTCSGFKTAVLSPNTNNANYGGVAREYMIVRDSGTLGIIGRSPYFYPGKADYVLFWIGIKSTTVQVSALASVGMPSMTFTRLNRTVQGASAFEVWIAQVPADFVMGWYDTTITWSGAAPKYVLGTSVVTGATGYTVGAKSSNSGSSTQVLAPSGAPNFQNLYHVMLFATMNPTVTVSLAQAKPASLSTVYMWNSFEADAGTVAIAAGPQEGKDYQARATFNGATTDNYGLAITFEAESVTLDDTEIQLTETGPVLNSSGIADPLYDVETITGLTDLVIAADSSQLDGADGSYVSAKYASGKTIVIDGTLYTTPPVDESILDDLKDACAPVASAVPLYYKLPSEDHCRIAMGKPIGFHSDFDRGRATGTIPYEIQFDTEDAFVSGERQMLVEDTSTVDSFAGINIPTFSLTVDPSYLGNAESFPDILFQVYADEVTDPIGPTGYAKYFQITAPSWFRQSSDPTQLPNYLGIVITATDLQAGYYKLSMKNRTLGRYNTDNGLDDYSSALNTNWNSAGHPLTTASGRQWFSLLPKISNLIRFSRPSTSAELTDGFALVFSPAWK